MDIGQENLKRLRLDVKPRTVVNYICELVAVPGKMNVKKALEMGVPNGPLLGKLQKGEDVTLKDGTVVRKYKNTVINIVIYIGGNKPIFC